MGHNRRSAKAAAAAKDTTKNDGADGTDPKVEAGAPDGTPGEDDTDVETEPEDDDDEEVQAQLAPLPKPKKKRPTGRYVAQCLLRHGETAIQPGDFVAGFSPDQLLELEKQGAVAAEMR